MATGGNQYSPSGVKVMRFNLTGDQWLGPSTFRVMFQVNSKLQTEGLNFRAIKPLHWNPAVFFRRARLICGGQVVEDIDNFNRLSVMLTALMPQDKQLEIACEGFGAFDKKNDGGGDADSLEEADNRGWWREGDYNESGTIVKSRRVLFKPLLGLFNQEKLLPLRYFPVQIELELANNAADCLFIGTDRGWQNHDQWDIADIQCKCDLLTLDNALDNEYASHLLSGKSLPIDFST